MIKQVVLVLTLVLACGVAQAATVYLKNGSTVTGKFIVRTDDSVKIDVSGITLTYYNDEIDRVEGESNKADVSVPAVATASVEATAPVATTASVAVQPAVPAAPAGQVAMESTPPAASKPASEVPASAKPPAQVDPYAGMTKRDLIIKFLDVYGTRKIMVMNFDQVKKTIPPNAVEVFERLIKVDEIIQELLPIYDKYFTDADLKVLISFYSSPIGRKLVEAVPSLMTESVDVSAEYFKAHLKELTSELKKAGVTSYPRK